jgi:small subunit ribosomal protein S9
MAKNTGDLAAEPSITGKEPAEGAGDRSGSRLKAEPPIVAKEPAEGADEGDTMGLTFGEGAPAEPEAAPRPAPTIRGKIDRFGVALGTGRRKTGVARVRIKDGTGQFSINGRTLEDYFVVERDRLVILAPLKATDTLGKVDITVNVVGGGRMGQAGAILLGIARALQAKNPANHPILSEGGYLTRDSRMVERKKYGHKKARRSFQFSKR